MNLEDLRKDQLIQEWLATINSRPSTERNYLLAMKHFTELIGKTPDQLLTEAEQEVISGKLMRQRNIKKYLIGFRKYLQEERGNADLTVKSHLTGVKSFYQTFDIEIPKLPRSGTKARPLKNNMDIPTKEDLQEVLQVCDPLEKAVLLVGISSGLGANEIRSLKAKDFKSGYDPETEITTLKLRREKVGFDFVTFLTPEASRAVWAYLDYRERTVKTTRANRVQQVGKQKIVSDDSYLFIGRCIPDAWIKTESEDLRKLEHQTFMKLFRTISEKSRKNTHWGAWNLIRSHNIRKYFNSSMLNAGADSFFVEFCMGHTLDSTRAAYFRASPEKLKEIYLKFVPYLTIQKEMDISESPEYMRIKQENQILQTETARHVVERSEYQKMLAENHKILENIEKMDAARKSTTEGAEILARLQQADPVVLTQFLEALKIIKS
jgi:Site-specific recombinase XerD